MVTMSEENGNQSQAPAVDKAADNSDQTSLPISSSEAKPTHHNFRSMADLLRAQEHPADDSGVTSRKPDITQASLRHEKNDENENSVQDLRVNAVNGQQRSDCSSLSLRQDHLRRWYNGDLNAAGSGDANYMVDVDGESSHSDIPSDLSSAGGRGGADLAPFNSTRRDSRDFDLSKSNEEEMLMSNDVSGENQSALKLSSPSDGENLSETDQDLRKSKRKQYHPKQRDHMRLSTTSGLETPTKIRKIAHYSLQEQVELMQQQLREIQSHVLCINHTSSSSTGAATPADPNRLKQEYLTPNKAANTNQENNIKTASSKQQQIQQQYSMTKPLDVKVNLSRNVDPKASSPLQIALQSSPTQGDTPKDLVDLAKTLKTELTSHMGTMVDTIMTKYAESLRKQHQKPAEVIGKEQMIIRNEAVKEKMAPFTHVSPVTSGNNRSLLNMSPRILPHSEHLQRNPCNNILESMKHTFPFAYNKLKQENIDKPLTDNTKVEIPKPHKPFELNKKMINPFFDHTRAAFENFHRPPWFPHLPFYPPAQMPTHSAFPSAFGAHLGGKEQEQTEALPLVVSSPKKKRTKVTDTRLSPRAARALLQEPVSAEQTTISLPPAMSPLNERKEIPMPPSSFHSSLVPASLPTSVAIPNPSLQQPDFFGLYGQKADHFFPRHEMNGFMPSTRCSPVRDDSPNTSYSPSDSPSFFKDSSSYGGGDQEMTMHDGYALISFQNNNLLFQY